MPNIQAKKKHLRQTLKRTEINNKIKMDIKTLIKKTKQAIEKKEDQNKIKENITKIQKMIDKAAQRNVIKENTANRKKSRLAAMYKKSLAEKK